MEHGPGDSLPGAVLPSLGSGMEVKLEVKEVWLLGWSLEVAEEESGEMTDPTPLAGSPCLTEPWSRRPVLGLHGVPHHTIMFMEEVLWTIFSVNWNRESGTTSIIFHPMLSLDLKMNIRETVDQREIQLLRGNDV